MTSKTESVFVSRFSRTLPGGAAAAAAAAALATFGFRMLGVRLGVVDGVVTGVVTGGVLVVI